MSDNKNFVLNTAMDLRHNGSTMQATMLVPLMNSKGFRTSYGGEYRPGRGIFTLIRATWKDLKSQGLHQEASAVAQSFLAKNGKPAWEERV
jgi:hypothetical protein